MARERCGAIEEQRSRLATCGSMACASALSRNGTGPAVEHGEEQRGGWNEDVAGGGEVVEHGGAVQPQWEVLGRGLQVCCHTNDLNQGVNQLTHGRVAHGADQLRPDLRRGAAAEAGLQNGGQKWD